MTTKTAHPEPDPNRPASASTLQATAEKFVTGYITTNPLNINDLSDVAFDAAMTAITKAMFAAWSNGYATGRTS